MAMRITTNMLSGQYKSQMSTTLNQLDYYSKRANDLRSFRKFSDDPMKASRAMRLRRSYTQNEDYQNNIKNIGNSYAMAESSALDVKDILDDAKDAILQSGNKGTVSQSDYSIYATKLRGLQSDMMTTINSKLNDTYVFGGANATEIPFTIGADGKLVYRGESLEDPASTAKIEAMATEKVYVDIGLGVNVDAAGNVDEASVFSDELNGIEFFGYGLDEDGMPKNIYNLLGEAAQALEDYANGDESAYNADIASKYAEKIGAAIDNLMVSTANLGIKTKQLESLSQRLVNTQEELNEQLSNMEYVNAEEAYTDYQWQQYVYNASLRIGSKLLQSSFLDYMK